MKAVKDVTFSNDGRQFLSCGYDRQMKLWDTETGQCLKRFSNGKIPYTVKFHPDEDKQNIFLAGMSDKKIIQVTPSFPRVVCTEPKTFIVRHQFRRDHAGIRSAFGAREHHYLRRREPPVRDYLRRQDDQGLGLRHPGGHQVHR